MVRYYTRYHSESTIFRIPPLVNSKDGVDVAMLFTLRESRRTSDPVLFRQRRTVNDPSEEDFTLDALALKPSDFCNVRVVA